MKTNFTICILLLSILVSKAQLSQQTGQQQIDQLKLSGNLPLNFQVANPHVSSKIYPRIYPPQNLVQSTNACNCLIPLDSTFSIAQFDASGGSGGPGLPPEYRNDDWSTTQILLPFTFCYFGQSYTSFYLNNNGNISFDSPYSTFTANSFPDPTFKMIAPFWADVDTRGPLSGLVYYKITSSSLIIRWDHVGFFPMQDTMLNTFQLIITDGNDPIVPNGNTSFCYGSMEWTTGSASGGTDGFGGTPATAGANLGDGVNYTQFGQFDQPGNAYDGQYNLNDGIDWLDSANFIFDLCPANVPPISVDCMSDTVVMHVTDTRIFDFYFLAPEISQTANITVQSGSLNNLTIISNTGGSYAHVQAELIADPGNIGYHTMTVTATDNGTPPASTSVSMAVQILPATDIAKEEFSSPTLYPNPMFEQSVLNVQDIPFNDLKFTLTDITGRLIIQKNLDNPLLLINKTETGTGFFLYRIEGKSAQTYSGKLMVY